MGLKERCNLVKVTQDHQQPVQQRVKEKRRDSVSLWMLVVIKNKDMFVRGTYWPSLLLEILVVFILVFWC